MRPHCFFTLAADFIELRLLTAAYCNALGDLSESHRRSQASEDNLFLRVMRQL